MDGDRDRLRHRETDRDTETQRQTEREKEKHTQTHHMPTGCLHKTTGSPQDLYIYIYITQSASLGRDQSPTHTMRKMKCHSESPFITSAHRQRW